MNSTCRLLHRVTPYHDELLSGFMMRASLKNRLLGPDELMCKLLGGTRNMLMTDMPNLAYMTLNTVQAVQQLSGIEQWQQGEPRWWVGSEWLSKSMFVTPRRSKICPACLAEQPYLRGIWSLSFYAVCARHQVRLVETCPNCQKRLKWNRRRPDYCGCTQSLAQIEVPVEVSHSASLSNLIAYRLEGKSHYLANVLVSHYVVERLAGLSVDGLCKTVWFLGHCLENIGRYGVGHGRKKPDSVLLESMVEKTFEVLQDWPHALGQTLQQHLQHKFGPRFTAVECHQLFAPLDHYFRSSIVQPELSFLSHVYEQYLQRLWRISGKPHHCTSLGQQLVLEF